MNDRYMHLKIQIFNLKGGKYEQENSRANTCTTYSNMFDS